MAARAERFKRGQRVSIKPEWRRLYVGKTRGEVIMATSLGIAVKVRWDGVEDSRDDWINMEHLEQETRR